MKNLPGLIALLAVCATTSLLQGCAGAVIVGGAAAGVAAVHDRRTAGALLDDQLIELQALENLNANEALVGDSHVNVAAYNGVLLITGEVPTEERKAQAYGAVRDIEKVRRIHNELLVAPPRSFVERSTDSWITAKVKTNLFDIPIDDFDPSRVSVTTENSTVYLMGLVSREEAMAATDIARRVNGVERVVKVFEYSD